MLAGRTYTLAIIACAALCGCGVDSPVGRDVGARCDEVEDCDERCILPANDYPGGLCTVSCDADEDCPGGTVCIEAEGGVCVFSCVEEPDCDFLGAGWVCRIADARPEGQVSVCLGD